jgi:hypothetical protein
VIGLDGTGLGSLPLAPREPTQCHLQSSILIPLGSLSGASLLIRAFILRQLFYAFHACHDIRDIVPCHPVSPQMARPSNRIVIPALAKKTGGLNYILRRYLRSFFSCSGCPFPIKNSLIQNILTK